MPSGYPNSQTWLAPNQIIPLPPRDLQVWRIDLPVSSAFFTVCRSVLNTEEIVRSENIKHPMTRLRSIVGRGALRLLLASNTSLEPSSIPVSGSAYGKPFSPAAAFNVTHSGNIILIAMQRQGEVGIDIEQISPDTPVLEIAKNVFAPAEIASLFSIHDEISRRTSFFDLWTQKEAILKADGRGMSLSPNSFVSETSTSILQPDGSIKIFHLHQLPVPQDYCSSLATDRASAKLHLLLFPLR